MSEETKTIEKEIESLRKALQQMQIKTLPASIVEHVNQAVESLAFISKHAEGDKQARLAALYKVSQTLGTSLDLEEVLNQVMDSVIGLTGADRGFLVLIEDGLEKLKVRVGRNVEQETLKEQNMEVSASVIREVANSGAGVVTTNAQDDPRFSGQESVITYALRSVLCAPLRIQDKVIGVIYVDNRTRNGIFDHEDLDMLNAFSSQAASAIQNARLYTSTDRTLAARVKELENLAWITRELNNQNTVEEVLETSRTWAIKNIPANEVWIAMQSIDDQNNRILTVSVGPNSGKKIDVQNPLVRGTLEGYSPHIFAAEKGQPARLIMPILTRNQAKGIFVVEWELDVPTDAMQLISR
ncbi:MAG: GAF domain-containing protein, partial [Chloroflexota bacterium]